MIYKTQEELDAAVALWQKRLRLQDWEVKAQFKRARDFVNLGAQAEISSSIEHKTACLSVLDPIDYDPANKWPQDHEDDVVHELVHLHLKVIDVELDRDLYDRLFTQREQVVSLIANSFIRLARGEA